MDFRYVEPSYKLNLFNCPYCSVYLQQTWYRVMHDSGGDMHMLPSYENDCDQQAESRLNVSAEIVDSSLKSNLFMEGEMFFGMENPCEPEAHIASKSDYVRFVKNVAFSKCSQCGKYAVWVRDKLVYPVIEYGYSSILHFFRNPEVSVF
jgi:hypothetical protein